MKCCELCYYHQIYLERKLFILSLGVFAMLGKDGKYNLPNKDEIKFSHGVPDTVPFTIILLRLNASNYPRTWLKIFAKSPSPRTISAANSARVNYKFIK